MIRLSVILTVLSGDYLGFKYMFGYLFALVLLGAGLKLIHSAYKDLRSVFKKNSEASRN